jgi:hypothetical protein
MSLSHSPQISLNGLVLCLDAANRKSYPGSGTTWTDLSGRGNNGTLVNGVGYSGSNLGSLSFDGSNDYGTITGASLLGGFTGNFSIEFWFKGSGQSAFAVFAEHYGPSNQRWAIQANNAGNTMIWVRDGNILITTSGVNPFNNSWHQHVVSRVGSTITYYIDTISTGTETYSGSLNSGTTLEIGRYSGTGFHINGNLSNLKIYRDKGLTTAEIQQNYNALKGRFGLT